MPIYNCIRGEHHPWMVEQLELPRAFLLRDHPAPAASVTPVFVRQRGPSTTRRLCDQNNQREGYIGQSSRTGKCVNRQLLGDIKKLLAALHTLRP